jgi:hypothetical protein
MGVKIKRVVHGKEARSVVPAQAVAHAQIRDDIDFLMVLRPAEQGSYVLTSAAIWKDRPRPRLALACT